MIRNISDFFSEYYGLTIILVSVLLIVGLFGCVFFSFFQTCLAYDALGYDTHFDVWAGCLIQTEDGYWVSYDNLDYFRGSIDIRP